MEAIMGALESLRPPVRLEPGARSPSWGHGLGQQHPERSGSPMWLHEHFHCSKGSVFSHLGPLPGSWTQRFCSSG